MGYTWLALVFWFGCLTVLLGAWNFGAGFIERWIEGRRTLRITTRQGTLISMGLVLMLAGWGWIEGNRIAVKEILIQSPLIPAATSPVRIVQVSDMHLGKPRGMVFARRVAEKVRALKPDILVSTGDFVDASTVCQQGVPVAFREIEAPLGKYAVLGNHEYYTGLAAAVAFHEAAGFSLLRGQAVSVTPWLALAGVDDPAAHYTRQGGVTVERAALRDIKPNQMVILLKHQPIVAPVSTAHVDLQLSGHTHGGQIFPFALFVRLFYRYGPGMHRISDRMLLYVSRGTGTWGAPLRLLARPEITLFVLAPSVSAHPLARAAPPS